MKDVIMNIFAIFLLSSCLHDIIKSLYLVYKPYMKAKKIHADLTQIHFSKFIINLMLNILAAIFFVLFLVYY